jgi:hypothetical protein
MTPWRVVSCEEFNAVTNSVDFLVKKGYKVSDWVIDISQRLNRNILTADIALYRVTLNELGFSTSTKLEDVYSAASKVGYSAIDPSIAIYIRSLYNDQPVGEWLRIAVPMDSMIDSDGVPHLPKMGHALKSFYVETYWSWPHAIFHPNNEFVFQRNL